MICSKVPVFESCAACAEAEPSGASVESATTLKGSRNARAIADLVKTVSSLSSTDTAQTVGRSGHCGASIAPPAASGNSRSHVARKGIVRQVLAAGVAFDFGIQSAERELKYYVSVIPSITLSVHAGGFSTC